MRSASHSQTAEGPDHEKRSKYAAGRSRAITDHREDKPCRHQRDHAADGYFASHGVLARIAPDPLTSG